jgi:hypothetical protein
LLPKGVHAIPSTQTKETETVFFVTGRVEV